MGKIILGGGISGLSAAFYLQKRFPSETPSIIEASFRLGGWIRSAKQEGGYIFEQGPRTIRVQGPNGRNTLELAEELGLASVIQPITKYHSAALNRMIYVNGELHRLPTTFWSMFKTQSPFSKPLLNYILKDIFAPRRIIPENDESIYSFVERRFGKEIADYAVSPLICGICAGNAKVISVKFLMESLFANEQRYGSVTKGVLYNAFRQKHKTQLPECSLVQRAKDEHWSLYSFKGGMAVLPQTLEQTVRQIGVNVRLNTPCERITIKNKEVTLFLNNGEKIVTDRLISCLPAYVLGMLLDGHDGLTGLLKQIEFVDVAVVNLWYKGKVLNKEGFGVLVAPKENLPILGVIFDSCCFPHGDGTNLTVMMGGFRFKEHFGGNPSRESLLEVALSQLGVVLGIRAKPDAFQVSVLKDCIPQYVVGHKRRVEQIKSYIEKNNLPLSICGASYNGVGVNDVIMSSRQAIDDILI